MRRSLIRSTAVLVVAPGAWLALAPGHGLDLAHGSGQAAGVRVKSLGAGMASGTKNAGFLSTLRR